MSKVIIRLNKHYRTPSMWLRPGEHTINADLAERLIRDHGAVQVGVAESEPEETPADDDEMALTEAALKSMNKGDIVTLAAGLEIELDMGMNKSEMIAVILDAQGGA